MHAENALAESKCSPPLLSAPPLCPSPLVFECATYSYAVVLIIDYEPPPFIYLGIALTTAVEAAHFSDRPNRREFSVRRSFRRREIFFRRVGLDLPKSTKVSRRFLMHSCEYLPSFLSFSWVNKISRELSDGCRRPEVAGTLRKAVVFATNSHDARASRYDARERGRGGSLSFFPSECERALARHCRYRVYT